MTTMVRITNVVEEGKAQSNGDVVVQGEPVGYQILSPGESVEVWLRHGDPPIPLVVMERWPAKPK